MILYELSISLAKFAAIWKLMTFLPMQKVTNMLQPLNNCRSAQTGRPFRSKRNNAELHPLASCRKEASWVQLTVLEVYF
jgi:hypothetical protein